MIQHVVMINFRHGVPESTNVWPGCVSWQIWCPGWPTGGSAPI